MSTSTINLEEITELKAKLTALEETVNLQNQTIDQYQQTEKALALLNKLGADLNQATTLGQVFQAAAFRATAIIPGELASISLLDATHETFETFALSDTEGTMAVGTQVSLVDTSLRRLIKSKRVRINSDLTNSKDEPDSQLVAQGIKSTIVAPLVVGNRVIGTLNIGSKTLDAYDSSHEGLMQQIGTMLATTIESRRLFTQTQAALAETELLYEAGRQINEATNLQEIVASVVETVRIPVINRALLFLFDYDKNDEMNAAIVVANWHSGQGTTPTKVGTQYPREVVAAITILISKHPVFSNNVFEDERMDPVSLSIFKQQNIVALAALPLWLGGRQIGSLVLESEVSHEFIDQEIRPYTALTRQMAVAVENIRLLDTSRETLAELAMREDYQKNIAQVMKLLNEGSGNPLADIFQLIGQAAQVSRTFYFETAEND
ncbi:MAG: GAF domain-containing protein, partial [Chloroflexota bacterium]